MKFNSLEIKLPSRATHTHKFSVNRNVHILIHSRCVYVRASAHAPHAKKQQHSHARLKITVMQAPRPPPPALLIRLRVCMLMYTCVCVRVPRVCVCACLSRAEPNCQNGNRCSVQVVLKTGIALWRGILTPTSPTTYCFTLISTVGGGGRGQRRQITLANVAPPPFPNHTHFS